MRPAQSHGVAPTIVVTPQTALVDEPVHIRLSSFAARSHVQLHAAMRDDLGRVWSSAATYRADESGAVDVASQPPVAGSYDGADAMGLFWSMTLDPAEPRISPFAKRDLVPVTATLTARGDGDVAASATIARRFVAPDVQRIPVREEGLAGTLFLPSGAGPHPSPHPGVLVVGGSGGGLQETTAALLASRGFAALALAYFAYEDLPEQLANIPLEYFAAALDWMARHEAIRGDRLGVLGRSRGGELALLLGATFAQIGAVVGCVPSAVLWGALGMSGAAWTLGGEELPYVHDRLSGEQSAAIFAREPSAATPWYLANLEDPAACEAAAIPVERTRGPILLLSGEDDQMWPSTLMCEMLMRRLADHHFPHRHEHLRYPGAGHLITAPYLPTTVNFQRHPVVGHTFTYGGAPREQARANADSWPRVLAFLRDSLQYSATSYDTFVV